MKISGNIFLLITYTSVWLNLHWPLQEPQSETRTSGRWGWQSPCQCWSLPLRSWPWERPGCYEAVYWPLSQIRTTWNNLEVYILVSWEATFPSTGGSSGLAFSQSWVCTTIGTSLGSEQLYLLFWLFVFWSWLKNLSSDKKMMWFGLAGFLLARRAFGTAAQVPSFTDLPLWIKTVC